MEDQDWEEQTHKTSLVVRILLLIALLFALVGAIRWAVNVTNANAKQVTGNLFQIENHLAKQSPTGPLVQVEHATYP